MSRFITDMSDLVTLVVRTTWALPIPFVHCANPLCRARIWREVIFTRQTTAAVKMELDGHPGRFHDQRASTSKDIASPALSDEYHPVYLLYRSDNIGIFKFFVSCPDHCAVKLSAILQTFDRRILEQAYPAFYCFLKPFFPVIGRGASEIIILYVWNSHTFRPIR